MSKDWWTRGEWADAQQDIQYPVDMRDSGISDLATDAASLSTMLSTPLGEPPGDFSVRSTYASRPINGYDFNLSATIPLQDLSNPWVITFSVPNGYRAVPLKWDVYYDTPPMNIASVSQSTVSITQNNAGLPYNGSQDAAEAVAGEPSAIIIGLGTDDPIETFFVCEENTTFGITGSVIANQNTTNSSAINVNCYGNLIPVTEVALPFAIANENNTKQASYAT